MSTDQVRARINENRVTFDAMIDDASLTVAQSRFRSAAAILQTAARFAWYNHPGVFQSPRLEALAAQIGQHLPRPKSTTTELNGHVVHVISQAYSVGGHTRLVWRWIENDHTRVSTVVLTGQQGVPVPQPLHDAVAASGGKIISLGERSSNLLVRAAELRQIAQNGADTVVLHVHPYDVLPSIALNDVAAKVVFLNHADHVFSVGVGTADVVADIRPAGQRLSLARRNVPPHRSAILPIPLSAPLRGDKGLARATRNLTDSCVIISIASGYKYGATPGNHFIDIHRDFVLAHPEVTLIVVGPESKDRWQEVSEETGGRFRAVGMVQGIDAYYDSADIYVDSIPFASLTSLLDAATRGVSVLASCSPTPAARLAEPPPNHPAPTGATRNPSGTPKASRPSSQPRPKPRNRINSKSGFRQRSTGGFRLRRDSRNSRVGHARHATADRGKGMTKHEVPEIDHEYILNPE